MYFGGMLNTEGETAFSGAKFRCGSVGCCGIRVLCTQNSSCGQCCFLHGALGNKAEDRDAFLYFFIRSALASLNI